MSLPCTSSDSYCRLCSRETSESEMMNIFDNSLQFIIRTKLQITVAFEDAFSHSVCLLCVEYLKQMSTFMRKCQRTQLRLYKLLDVNDNEDESEEKVDHSYFYTNVSAADTDNEVISNEETITLSQVPASKRCKITAENCDNIIIPSCSYVISEEEEEEEEEEEVIPIETSPQIESPNKTTQSKKVPLSKIVNFFRTRIQQKKQNQSPLVEENGDVCGTVKDPTKLEHLFDSGDWALQYSSRRRIPPKLNEDDEKCPYCSWFIPKDEYDEHLSLHNNGDEFHKLVLEHGDTPIVSTNKEGTDFECPDCDEKFGHILLFEEHKNLHRDYRPMRCHMCEHSFVSRRRLRQHLCATHTERAYKCDECPYRAKNPNDIQKHKLGVHSDERIMCPVCGKQIAAFAHNLKKHLETHNEVGTYKCGLCEAAFRTNAGLIKHRENKHFPIPTMCAMCGTQCASKQKYKKHLVRCRKRNKLSI